MKEYVTIIQKIDFMQLFKLKYLKQIKVGEIRLLFVEYYINFSLLLIFIF